ncbi:MAG: hypothetical protein AB7F41_05680 [Methylocystis sp.]|uniref:hypothetical protein n=1 Tax=Methylocystis sp. TaxID=1911079 RepID=UPI003D0DCF46
MRPVLAARNGFIVTPEGRRFDRCDTIAMEKRLAAGRRRAQCLLPIKWTSTVKVVSACAALFGKRSDATICLSNLALQQLRRSTVCD